MARIITKELAVIIRNKLEAQDITPKNAAHERWAIYHNGQLVASFGIRRSSSKDIGHDFIPKELNIRTGFAKQIATCSKNRQDYLREIGLLPALSAPALSPATAQQPLTLPPTEEPEE